MLSQDHFKKEMVRHVENFGPEEYSRDRLTMIYKICSDLTDKSFTTIIDFFLETARVKYPPLPKEFREQAVIMKKTEWAESKKLPPVAQKTFEFQSSSNILQELAKQHGVEKISDLFSGRGRQPSSTSTIDQTTKPRGG